jgi:D-alanyl-D-alanine carboxypeptidase
MKKWVFWLVLLLLFGYEAAEQIPEIVTGRALKEDYKAQGDNPGRNGQTIKISKEDIYRGDLLLVGKEHSVPQGAAASEAVKLAQHKELIKGAGLLDNTIQLSPRLAEKFSAMIRAADKDGVRHFQINSGYRGNEEQSQLYRQMGAKYAMPAGYSEHNLGLSLDIGSSQGEMDRSAEAKWLKENAYRYGFVLRYPKDKTAITGIQYEPWHFRYVGLPHSAVMQEHSFVLEQYLDYLKQKKTVSITIDRQTYTISYYPVSSSTTIQVPTNSRYEWSGNNVDGIILTVY